MHTDALRTRIATAPALEWDALLADILQAFACTTGTLHLWDEGRGLLVVKAHRGIPDFLLPRMAEIPVGKGMAGVAAERRTPVQICNLQTDTSGVARPSAKETKVEGALTVPLLDGPALVGTLGIAKPVPYDFTEAEVAALVAVGEAITERLRAPGPAA